MNSGAYQLFIEITKDIEIQIGALGIHQFKKGKYVYTGSAMKNLSQRVERHKSLSKLKTYPKLHWHIDYLLVNENVKIADIKLFPSTERYECELNQKLLSQSNVSVPVKKFGSSDCSICPSHFLKID